MKITISRHGETDGNKLNLICGQSDSARLSQLGNNHAKNIVKIFKNQNFDSILCSPLTRAFDTAKPISEETGIKREKINELKEMDFGLMDGKTEKEAEIHIKNRNCDLSYNFPNGENYNDVLKRINLFTHGLLKQKYKSVFIFTHAGILRALLATLLNIDISNPKNLTSIAINNEVVYTIDTEKNKCSWINTLTNEKGEGLIYTK